MALTSTLLRFQIKLSDVDRGIYETLELRVPQHPSESETFLLTRVIAYALNTQDGIEWSGGIGTPDEAAIYVKDLTGQILLWIDIGNPSARRLHKASKASKAVRIYTYRDPQILFDEVTGQEIYKSDSIEIFSLKQKFLDALAETLNRDNAWELLHTEGELSITTKKATIQGEIQKHSIV